MTEPVETNTRTVDNDMSVEPSGTSRGHSQPESRLLELIADIKAISEQSSGGDPREEHAASKAERTMPEASRIAAGHGYDIAMLDGGHARDLDALARDLETFWRECVAERDWNTAHEANKLLSQLTLVEPESWH